MSIRLRASDPISDADQAWTGLVLVRPLTTHDVVADHCHDCALITDGRFSGGSHGFVIGHVAPEAQDGGPIALVSRYTDRTPLHRPRLTSADGHQCQPAKQQPAGLANSFVCHPATQVAHWSAGLPVNWLWLIALVAAGGGWRRDQHRCGDEADEHGGQRGRDQVRALQCVHAHPSVGSAVFWIF